MFQCLIIASILISIDLGQAANTNNTSADAAIQYANADAASAEKESFNKVLSFEEVT